MCSSDLGVWGAPPGRSAAAPCIVQNRGEEEGCEEDEAGVISSRKEYMTNTLLTKSELKGIFETA